MSVHHDGAGARATGRPRKRPPPATVTRDRPALPTDAKPLGCAPAGPRLLSPHASLQAQVPETPMSSPSSDASAPSAPLTDNRRELSFRAVVVGLLVAAFVGASYPYVVLKIGFGPNVSVVSAFFGYLILTVIGALATRMFGKDHASNRYEYNMVQTAGTAGAQAGFMCVVLAAFDMLASRPELDFHLNPSAMDVFLWLSIAGCLGVLLAVPLRKHYIDEEKLTFADGVAAGETLMVLDQKGESGKRRLRMLGIGGVASALVTWFRDGVPSLIPGVTHFGAWGAKLNVGLSWSLLEIGSGLLVGLRITMSMAIGMAVGWMLLPPVLQSQGWVPVQSFAEVLRWTMWPATGMMVAGGLTALALKWKLVLKTFKELRISGSSAANEFPIRWVMILVPILAIALIVQQAYAMDVPPWLSIIAILVSMPLMLVGTRVLGETNWAPISALSNMVQAIFAAIAPGNVAVNMVASGMSGTVASNGEHLMQDYKAGKIIGSNNRSLTYMQLLATPVGALAVALVYPLLRSQYGIGAERYGLDPALAEAGGSGLSSPISVKWAGFAEVLSNGLDQLPPFSFQALLIGVALGVLLTLGEGRFARYLPSATGIGLGMLIPAQHVLPMVLGGLIQFAWSKARPSQEAELNTPLASGFIVGEAMLALIIPLLYYFGVLSPGGGGH